MSIQFHRLPKEPIIVVQILAPVDPAVDPPAGLQEVTRFKKEIGRHVYRIMDFTKASLTFSQLMLGMAAERSQEGGNNDPAVTTLVVGTDEIMKFAVTSLREQGQYGAVNVETLFPSLDAALAHARKRIAAL